MREGIERGGDGEGGAAAEGGGRVVSVFQEGEKAMEELCELKGKQGEERAIRHSLDGHDVEL